MIMILLCVPDVHNNCKWTSKNAQFTGYLFKFIISPFEWILTLWLHSNALLLFVEWLVIVPIHRFTHRRQHKIPQLTYPLNIATKALIRFFFGISMTLFLSLSPLIVVTPGNTIFINKQLSALNWIQLPESIEIGT